MKNTEEVDGKMLRKLYSRGIRYIAMAFSGYLFVQGLFTLCNIRRVTEQTYFIRNNPLTGLAAVALFFLLSMLLRREKIGKFLNQYGTILFFSVFLAMALFLGWWITQTQFWYYGDTEKIYMCAGGFLNKDFQQWMPGGYAQKWPHQNGMILFVALLLKLFEVTQTFVIFAYVSLFFWMVTVLSLRYTLLLLFEDKALVNVQSIMLALYLPYAFFVNFMYGDVPGYGFAAAAVYFAVRYHKKNHPASLILSAVLMALGICFKQNCMIVLVGIVIFLAYDLLRPGIGENARVRWGAFAGFLVIVFFVVSLPNRIVESVSQLELSSGNSKYAHVAMGLQGSEKAPGWYNTYNERVYEENDYDTEAAARASKENIRGSVNYFIAHPMFAWSFFHHKLALEWNNPTFECFHIQNFRNTSLELSGFVKSVINDGGKANILLIFFMDMMQSALYFGIFLFFLLWKGEDPWSLLFGLLFIGAFLFWMFWESKPLYVLPYFLFMIPYALKGYWSALESWNSRKFRIGMAVMGTIVLIVTVSDAPIVTKSLKLQEDTESYYLYIHEFNKNFMNLRY